MTRDLAALATRAVRRIRPHLAGLPPEVQSAALADLLAMWLAGHQPAEAATDIDAWREELLALHITLVRKLIPVNDAALKKRRFQ